MNPLKSIVNQIVTPPPQSKRLTRIGLCLLLGMMGVATESNAIEFTFEGDTYDTVISTATGRVWLDRNLGAMQTATSTTDTASFGDLYQWGRAADGHQLRTSSTIATQATRITPANNADFIILSNDWPTRDTDSDGSLRTAAWADGGVNDICPAGFSVPTETEWKNEIGSLGFLNLPHAGSRGGNSGTLSTIVGYSYWSRSVGGSVVSSGLSLVIDPNSNDGNSPEISLAFRRTNGNSIRCIMDVVASNTAQRTLNQAILPRLIQAMIASSAIAIDARIDATFSDAPQGENYNLDGELSVGLRGAMMKKLPTYAKSLQNDTLDWKQMLGNSSFMLPLNATDGDAGNADTGAAIWGSGDYRRLDSDGDINWEGSLFSVQLGMDKRIRDNLLVGGLLSSSKGDVDYTLNASKGKYSHKMTSIHPYLAWSEAGVSLWGSVGYGRGKLDIDQTGSDKSRSNTSLLSLAGGVKGALPEMEGLSLKSDIALARTDIKASADGNIGKQTINSQRLRLILEMSRERVLTSGVLKPSLEIGARYDGGDGDTGVGAVLGAGLRYANATGLSMEGKVHALVGRKKYQEWGVSGVIRQQTGVGGHGLAFSLSPSYGKIGSNANQVWQGISEGNSADGSAKLNINIGYGLSAGGGLLTPYSEATLGERARNYRLGIRWKPDSPFDLNLVGEREESSGANNRVLLESRIWF